MGAKTETYKSDSVTPPVGSPPRQARHVRILGKAERARLQTLSPQDRFNGKDFRAAHTVVPHSYFTVLPRKCRGGVGAQHFVVGYIMDRTFGDPGRPEWAKINCIVLARLTGLNSRAFTAVLEDAAEVGIVKRRRPGCTACDEGHCDCPGRDWEYKTYPEEWALLPDREKAGAAAPDPGEGDKPEVIDEVADSGAMSPHVDRLLKPGATAKRIALTVQLKGVSAPVDMHMQPTNNSPWPLLFRYAVSSDGTIREFIHADPEWRTNSEVRGTAVPPEFQGTENKRVASEFQKQELVRYRAYFNPVFVRELKKPLDEPFLRQIAEASQYAPVTDFDAPIANLKKRKLLSSGMILTIAKDQIGPAWATRRKDVEAKAVTKAATEAMQRAESARLAPLNKALNERCGESLDEFRRITGNSKAEIEDWFAAQEAVKLEFGEASHG